MDIFNLPSSASRRRRPRVVSSPPPSTKKRKRTVVEPAKTTISVKSSHLVSKRQRVRVLQMLDRELAKCIPDRRQCAQYGKRVEQRIFRAFVVTGARGGVISSLLNHYRITCYRNKALQLVRVLRHNGPFLVTRYDPELLVSLPHLWLVEGTPSGDEMQDWKRADEMARETERLLRKMEQANEGIGWSKCYKCGGSCKRTMLQTRSADEGMTVFLTCLRCENVRRF